LRASIVFLALQEQKPHVQRADHTIESSVLCMCHARVANGSTITSCRHFDIAIRANDRGTQLPCRKTHIDVTRAIDIPARVPEYVRPVARARAANSEPATRSVAFVNDGVME
jgi:hypothetical protein